MKKALLSLLAIFGLSVSAIANASLVTYDITVAGGQWVTVGPTAFGLGGQPDLGGWVTFDNALTGIDAIQSFYFTTGTHTWDLSEFVGPVANAYFDRNGNLSQFSLANFTNGDISMYFHSNNTVNVFSNAGAFFCNQCVSFAPGIARAIPEPTTLALVGLGIVWLGIRMRKK
jgi:hypothetical protein